MEKLDKDLLFKVASLHDIPAGAYNIRKNGKSIGRSSTKEIVILPKKDKDGIDIKIAPNTKNQSVHIPVIVTQDGFDDLVYNDFYIGKNSSVLIVAGCGLHNNGGGQNSHNGVHEFWVEEGAQVRYVEKHFAQGKEKTQKNLSPKTIIHLAKNAKFVMETAQLGGVSFSQRTTFADLDQNAVLEIKESILTEKNQIATTNFVVDLNGKNSKASVVSRAVANGSSCQSFTSKLNGNNLCFGHVECDAIASQKAKITSTPALVSNNANAQLSHEAYIGKIATEQLEKLESLGLTKDEAEKAIINGFLK